MQLCPKLQGGNCRIFLRQKNINYSESACFLEDIAKIKKGFNLFRSNEMPCNEIYRLVNDYIYEYVEKIETEIPRQRNLIE